MSRTDWTFEYPAEKIADAARVKAQYHRDRYDYWDGEIAAAEAAIQEKGIDIRSYDVTGGKRHEVVIDPALSNRLSEAEGKRQQHGRKADEYRDWCRVLELDPEKRLELDFNDVLFFGLADVPVAV
jgi:hypothetical protein